MGDQDGFYCSRGEGSVLPEFPRGDELPPGFPRFGYIVRKGPELFNSVLFKSMGVVRIGES